MSQPPNTISSSRRQRHDVADLRRAPFGPLAETDRAHLRQRADRFGESFANGEDAGDGRGADGAEADEQNTELAACRSNFNRCRTRAKNYIIIVFDGCSCSPRGMTESDTQLARRRHDRREDGRSSSRRSAARDGGRLARDRRESRPVGPRGRSSCPTKRRRRARAKAPPKRACSSRSNVAPPTRLPLEDDAFDLAVIDDTGGLLATMRAGRSRARRSAKLLRVLRPGGRVMVIGAVPRGGLGALFTRAQSGPPFRPEAVARSRRLQVRAHARRTRRTAVRGGIETAREGRIGRWAG